MGINIAPLGEILGDGEEVLRGLNPKHCENGLPTRGCFCLRANDPLDDGQSFGILWAPAEQAAIAPLGARQGISPELLLTKLPSPEFGIAQLNVGKALQEVRGRDVIFCQKDDDVWGEHRTAHAMMTGYQTLGSQTRNDLQRYLAKLAAEAILKKPAAKKI